MIKRETYAKRQVESITSIDREPGEFDDELLNALVQSDHERQLRESRKAVETMIRFASEELREALSDLLTLEQCNYKHYLTEPLSESRSQSVPDVIYRRHVRQQQLRQRLQREVQKLRTEHNVSINDFRMVMQGLT